MSCKMLTVCSILIRKPPNCSLLFVEWSSINIQMKLSSDFGEILNAESMFSNNLYLKLSYISQSEHYTYYGRGGLHEGLSYVRTKTTEEAWHF